MFVEQVNGHFMAKTDPLGLDDRKMPIELDPQLYGFSDKDLDRECASSSAFAHRVVRHPGTPAGHSCSWLCCMRIQLP